MLKITIINLCYIIKYLLKSIPYLGPICLRRKPNFFHNVISNWENLAFTRSYPFFYLTFTNRAWINTHDKVVLLKRHQKRAEKMTPAPPLVKKVNKRFGHSTIIQCCKNIWISRQQPLTLSQALLQYVVVVTQLKSPSVGLCVLDAQWGQQSGPPDGSAQPQC